MLQENLPWILPTLGFVGLITMVWNNQKTTDGKISRAYQRLDEVKEINKKEFTLSQVCDEKHKHLTATLEEMKSDIKFLVRKANGVK